MMKALFLATTIALSTHAHARLPDAEAWRWVAAIRVAEGNPNYGVLSVKTTDPRRVCYNTVQNTHDRWLRAGRPGVFLVFLARRYCPPSVDPQGHRNWIKNVGKLVDKTHQKEQTTRTRGPKT